MAVVGTAKNAVLDFELEDAYGSGSWTARGVISGTWDYTFYYWRWEIGGQGMSLIEFNPAFTSLTSPIPCRLTVIDETLTFWFDTRVGTGAEGEHNVFTYHNVPQVRGEWECSSHWDGSAPAVYSFEPITMTHEAQLLMSAEALFEIKAGHYRIDVSHSGEGTVTPSTVMPRGSSYLVRISPAAGHYIEAVLIDGSEASNVLTGPASSGKVAAYRFDDIDADHTLEVIFAAATVEFDWTEGFDSTFEYIRVDARTLEELETLHGIAPGGSISENLNTTLKASGQLEMVGDIDIKDDLIRIYLIAKGEEATERVALGTFFVSTPTREVNDAGSTADADLYSLLLKLDEDRVEQTYTVPKGTNAITHAAGLVASSGLVVDATSSTSATTTDAVFEAGTSKLEIVNYLLDFAGYASVSTDGMGTVILEPYKNPAERQPVYTFEDNEASIFMPEVTDELDWYATPNVVLVTCSNADTVMTATAENDNPSSPYSTVSRGRRIVRHEDVSDIADQTALADKAAELLESSSRSVQKATITHTYAPFELGDVIRLNYTQAGIDYDMAVQSRELTLSAGVPTTTEARRFVRA